MPREFIPAVEKGLRETLPSGVLAGFPVVDIKFTLFDGSYHDVDSNENAFRMAASMAFKEGMKKASPTLLEPMMAVEVETPEDYMGNVMGDLSSRRGIVQGMEDQVKALAVYDGELIAGGTFFYAGGQRRERGFGVRKRGSRHRTTPAGSPAPPRRRVRRDGGVLRGR